LCPVLFQVGGLPIYSYGLMLAIAVAVGLFGALKLARIEGCEEDLIYELTIVMVVCGILGARLFYVVFYAPDYFAANPWAVLDLRTGGLVFYGGLLGGLLGGLGYIVKKRLSFWNLADIFAPFLALGYSIARIGCFLNGCCYGKPTELPWGVVFPSVDLVSRHPTQLYSSFLSLLLFTFLYWLFPRRSFSGQVFLTYLAGYGVVRFIIEFWRENLVVWHGFTIAQVTAVLVILMVIPIYLSRKKNKKYERVL
jgi:phosphatidylglycerol:prolipoprotein diacylglycerol transferase